MSERSEERVVLLAPSKATTEIRRPAVGGHAVSSPPVFQQKSPARHFGATTADSQPEPTG